MKLCNQQALDADIVEVIRCMNESLPITVAEYQKIRSQLLVIDGVLMRSIKLPISEVVQVPVLPLSLEQKVLVNAHKMTGHGSWEVTWKFLRARCYFVNMAVKCKELVMCCRSCSAANAKRGPTVPPSRPVLPAGPWNTVQIDTLELGSSSSNREFSSVLVCVDTFTKWVEVVPLKRHDGASVASAFLDVCCRWGPPQVIRSDNGSEFCNSVVKSLFEVFGVTVKHGAVRHPQSQGAAERFNRTLLTLIRKTLDEADDWRASLDLLLYYYRTRPHAVTNISPMLAMVGWQPSSLLVENAPMAMCLSAWTEKLSGTAARIRDYLEVELSKTDFVEPNVEPSYCIGDHVLLRTPDRRQKRRRPYESGWYVADIVSPSTVLIEHESSGSTKVVNVDMIKLDPVTVNAELPASEDVSESMPSDSNDDSELFTLEISHDDAYQPSVIGGYSLRNRDRLPQRDLFQSPAY